MDYTKMYDEYRKAGNDEFMSFAYVVKVIALAGTMKDLQALYDHHNKDFLNETEKFLNELREELGYEKDSVVKSQVS